MNDQLRDDLTQFCRVDCNRYEFLINWLTKEEINHSVIPTGTARHIIIRLDKIRPYLKRYYVKTLVAHYDRVPGTPGANDNSAAVIQLLYSINKIKSLKYAHNIQIIFTDKEELSAEESLVKQGAYQLAHLFLENKIDNCIFFVFDMCGIGDTLISGRAGIELLKSKYDHEPRYNKMYRDMIHFNKTLSDLFLGFRNGEYFNLNSLFSDDLGFLLNRYPAVQISVLPYSEAILMKQNLLKIDESIWNQILEKGLLSKEYRDFLQPLLPHSWNTNHSANDRVETLTDSAFEIIADFIMELAQFQIPYGEVN